MDVVVPVVNLNDYDHISVGISDVGKPSAPDAKQNYLVAPVVLHGTIRNSSVEQDSTYIDDPTYY